MAKKYDSDQAGPFIKEMPVDHHQRAVKKKRSVNGKRRLTLVCIGILMLVFFSWKTVDRHFEKVALQETLVQVQENLQTEEDYHEELEKEIKLLEDEEYVAKKARNEYFLSGEGEIIFNFIDEEDQEEASNQAETSTDQES